LVALAAAFPALFRQRTTLPLEILALRHQLDVLQRSVKRPKLTAADRFFGLVVGGLGGLATEFHQCQAGDGDRLAPQGIPPVLDMENSTGKVGTTGHPGGRPILDSGDSPGQPAQGVPRIHGGVRLAGIPSSRHSFPCGLRALPFTAF
jgi:hypothetical protein